MRNNIIFSKVKFARKLQKIEILIKHSMKGNYAIISNLKL